MIQMWCIVTAICIAFLVLFVLISLLDYYGLLDYIVIPRFRIHKKNKRDVEVVIPFTYIKKQMDTALNEVHCDYIGHKQPLA